jgi:alkylation response protein AidB-like acyl-CoA dehydrogenase
MNFDLNPEQIQIQDSFARFFADSANRHSRALKNSVVAEKPIWAQAAQMGIAAMLFSEENGGLYNSPTETMIAMEQVGKSLCNIPLSDMVFACRILDKSDDFNGRQGLIDNIISGEVIITTAFEEFNNRTCGKKISLNASKKDNHFVLNGSKTGVAAAKIADYFLINANMAYGKKGVFLVKSDAEGIDRDLFTAHDTSPKADLYLDNVAAELICNDDNVFDYAFDFTAIALCYEAIGMMDRITNLTSEYIKTRTQFGVPLSSFQVLQHRAVDMLIETEQASSIAVFASLMLDNDNAANRESAVSNAKIRTNNAARFVSQQAVQLHGGIGMTDEYIGAHYFKRLTLLGNMMGDNLFHLKRLDNAIDILEI